MDVLHRATAAANNTDAKCILDDFRPTQQKTRKSPSQTASCCLFSHRLRQYSSLVTSDGETRATYQNLPDWYFKVEPRWRVGYLYSCQSWQLTYYNVLPGESWCTAKVRGSPRNGKKMRLGRRGLQRPELRLQILARSHVRARSAARTVMFPISRTGARRGRRRCRRHARSRDVPRKSRLLDAAQIKVCATFALL